MAPGDQLDGYTLLRPIGRGGYGEVWLCRSDAMGDFRALKFIGEDSPDLLEMEFRALACYRKAASKLRSPHLMPIEHAGRNAKGLYYVMPLADGIGDDPATPGWQPLTLGALIRQRACAQTWFSCDEIAEWICPVLDALQTLANAGFVHRDVKPDNILIFGGRPTLGDISLLHEDSATLSRRGTPGYLTPSWYAGGHPDMYGATATLYTLLTGNQPDRMGRSAFNAPPQGETSLTPGEQARRKVFQAVIRRATEERPEERYRDFLDMAAALSGQKKPVSLWKRVPTRAILAAFLVVVVAAFLTLARSRQPGPPPPAAPASESEPWEKGRITRPATAPASPAERGETGKIAATTKDKPFINSLGMKFVPVPGTDVLFCIHETRWKDYAKFAEANPGIDTRWTRQNIAGFQIEHRAGDHPVMNLTWEEAKAFCTWLGEKENKVYRLPTDREWSVAVGLESMEIREPGDTPESIGRIPNRFPWGTSWPPPPGTGNFSDRSRKERIPSDAPNADCIEGYDDGFPTTAPVMSFAANELGLYDLDGNVQEWIEDWWNAAKTDRVLRGGSWSSYDRGILFSSARYRAIKGGRSATHGFRVVLEAGASPVSAAQLPAPQAAAKAARNGERSGGLERESFHHL